MWEAVEDLFRTGLQPAMTLVIRRGGKIVLKRGIGCVRGNLPGQAGPAVPIHPDAPVSLFSASKAITARSKARHSARVMLHPYGKRRFRARLRVE